jgi:hypothetical protein
MNAIVLAMRLHPGLAKAISKSSSQRREAERRQAHCLWRRTIGCGSALLKIAHRDRPAQIAPQKAPQQNAPLTDSETDPVLATERNAHQTAWPKCRCNAPRHKQKINIT